MTDMDRQHQVDLELQELRTPEITRPEQAHVNTRRGSSGKMRK